MENQYQELIEKMGKDVEQFRRCFGLPVGDKELTNTHINLHDSLIIEELIELADATTEIEKLDAIVDSCYVLVGRNVHHERSYSMTRHFICILISVAEQKGYNFEGAWDEVHASNMSKLCVSFNEAEMSIHEYMSDGIGYSLIDIEEVDGFFVLKNAEEVTLDSGKVVKAGKVLKSMFYKEANLEPFLGIK